MVNHARTLTFRATTGLTAAAAAAALWASPVHAATPVDLRGANRVLSVDENGTTLGGRAPSVSADGRYTAYVRAALVNGDWGIVLHDATSGTDTVVGPVVSNVVVSANGRFLAYGGYPGGDSSHPRVYRYNIATGKSTIMPEPDTGGAAPYSIAQISVSANGGNIAYLTAWADSENPVLGHQDVFATDAVARTTTSLGLEAVGSGHQVQQPSISGDGKWVAFATLASLAARDTNAHFDIYEREIATGATALASRTAAGGTGNKESTSPWISKDGRYVAFSSRSSNLATGITDTSVTQTYVFDRVTEQTKLVSRNPAGVAGNAFAAALGISSTGRFIVFESAASDFGFPANPSGLTGWQIYRYDRTKDTVGLVSHAAGKTYPSNRGSGALDAVISADGLHIAYSSTSRDLDNTGGITDGFGTLDLFAWSP